jgi:RimJ/RimL family protein N-acetyltransferase
MVTIRKTEENDNEFIVSCLANKLETFINQCGYGKRFFITPITSGQISAFQKARSDNSLFFTILNDGVTVGSLELIISKNEEKCKVARFLISDQYRFKGYGTDTLRLLKEYAFNELNLKKITLGVFYFNESALKCYKKAGFIETERVKIEDWIRIDMEITNPAL